MGYITLYFAASLEIQNEFNILIVSGTGFSTANLLSAKLKSLFNINIVALVPISEVPEILDKHNVDLIVSTSTFNITNIDTHIPCVVVNPLLTQEDILLFRQYIKKIRKKQNRKDENIMKGFAMLGIGKVGWIEKEKPKAGPYDAIVKPIAVAPCTSDIHTVFEGALGGEREDMLLGHEAVGEVVEVGSEVKDFKPGDRVVVPAITPDWRTIESQRGFSQHSGEMLAGWKFSNFKDGVFAEFFHVNDADMNLAHLPDNVSVEAGVMITDMVTTGFHGAELADIKLGDVVAVIGIGPVGLMAIAGAKIQGAGRILGVGSRKALVEAAKFYGATDIVNYKNGPVDEQIMELTNGKGVDKVIIAGAKPDIMKTAVKIVKPGGGIVSNVNYYGEGDIIPIPRIEWGSGMAHKTIIGGLTPGGRDRMERLIDLVIYNRVDPSKLVTHTFHGFDHIEEALIMMKDKQEDLIKPIVFVE